MLDGVPAIVSVGWCWCYDGTILDGVPTGAIVDGFILAGAIIY